MLWLKITSAFIIENVFVEWYDEDDEDASEIFETENEMFQYLKNNGIKE